MTIEGIGAETTRRGAVKLGGGAALALLVAGLGRGTVTIAQEATPAGESAAGQYAVIRLRTLRADHDAGELFQRIQEGYVPLVREVPGFISYTAIADPATRDQAYIAVFADKTGTDESTRIAGEWLADNGIDAFEGDPIVVEGAVAFSVEAEEAPAHHH